MKFRRIAAIVLTTALVVPGYTYVADAFGVNAPSGVDVSTWQHPGDQPINWHAVKADGQSFAIIKATEGLGYVNKHFAEDSRAAAEAGLLVGSYHMGRATSDPRLQAAEYAAVLRTQPQPSLPPVLDIEYNDGVSPAGMQAWIRAFVDELRSLTGRTPVIYTYRYFWENEVGNTTEFNDLPLWLAAYQSAPPTVLPGGWDYMTMWQRTGSGRVSGIPVDTDMNLFNGTDSQLQDFVAGTQLNLTPVDVPGIDELAAFGQANPKLVGAILAAAAGVVAVGTILTVARDMGIDIGPAQALVETVQQLIAEGKLPVGDLQNMLANGTYSVGDLIILLENVAKFAG
ncbi:glycoside hydrolase family 25 protein [Corynebacterium aquilae]|uniref:Hydrolase n=1 Tax=Corynebacterium aquilae DSM 44791 TaxID=1431546 RepID=A0A1L7CD83_9CORY|nr:glycoside hydrolase family 25 protein [Corynebacterium aquilae]APT83801.1 hypothetical protein CAQU_00400 [Corynebacterium aquilae DSM 44791]